MTEPPTLEYRDIAELESKNAVGPLATPQVGTCTICGCAIRQRESCVISGERLTHAICLLARRATLAEAKAAEMQAENAALREAFRRYEAGEIRVEYGRHDVTQKAAYWGFDVRYWNGVTIPRQAVGPFAEPLKAALAVAAKGKTT